MKKLLLLAAALVMSVGAWADGSAYTELVAGKLIKLQSYYIGSEYMYSDGTNLKMSSNASMSRFLLVSAADGGFYIQHQGTGKYVSPTPNGQSVPMTMTDNQESAGRYGFEQATPDCNPSKGSFTMAGTTCVYIKCLNPGRTDRPSLHYSSGGNGNVLNWDTNKSGGGNAWVVTAIEEAPAVVYVDQLKNRATYAMVNIQPNGRYYFLNSNGDELQAPDASVVKSDYAWPESAKFVAEKQSEGRYAFKNVANQKYLAYKRFDANINDNLSVWTVSTGTRYNNSGIKTFVFSVNKRASNNNSAGTLILSNDGVWDNWGNNENTTNGGFSNTYGFVLLEEPAEIPEEDIQDLKKKISDVFNAIIDNKVGYPYYNTEEDTPQANQDAVNALGNYVVSEEVSSSNYDDALKALNAVYDLTAINLPIDGKAYTIKAVYSSGEDILYYDTTTKKIKGATAPEAGKVFVCKKTGENKFLLVNEYGKYLTWGSSTSVPSNTSAVVDEYSKYADVTIAKATPRTNGTGADASNAGRFGLVTLQAFKQDTETLWYSNYIHGHGTNNFVESDNTSKWYDGDGNRTHMYRIEEVANYEANTLTFNENAAKEVEGKTEYVATFYTPYEVVVPENVTVYTAQQTSGYLKTDKVESCTVIPRNTGVIVTYNAHDEKVTFVPATEEANTVSEYNNLSGSSVVMTQEEDKTYYVLSVVDDVVGFYKLASGVQLKANRAFYATNDSAVQGFVLNFDGEGTTGIQSLIESAKTNGVCFDLAGRRVNANVKGISIQNNKKVIR